MRSPTIRRLALSAVALAVLAGSTGCWCGDVPDEIETYDYEQVIADSRWLRQIRSSGETDETRCAAACLLIAHVELDEVISCHAVGNNDLDDAFSEENDEIEITCTGQKSYPGFCTGRRPQGHREANLAVVSPGTWFAAHAHLERASVTAFLELAEWLERRGAPASLVERCRCAAQDEVVHAEIMTSLALGEGGTPVPACEAEMPSDALFDVALHNAVEGCVHESFAAVIAFHQASHARDAHLRTTFERIAADELRHGQLAWDLHDWLLTQLDETQRLRILDAQRHALAGLPDRAAQNARTTPGELGWPVPARAGDMAAHFAHLLDPSWRVVRSRLRADADA